MEILDRYLQAVGAALPKAHQADVLTELRDNILSQIEDQERVLGRPLDLNGQAALLEKLGHPMALAARYRPQQYLIGPELYPLYLGVLKFALAIAVLAQLIAVVTIALAHTPLPGILGTLGQFPLLAFTVFGWVTLAFAGLELLLRRKSGKVQRWDPRELPAVVPMGRLRSRTESITTAAIATAAMVWWLAALYHPYLIFGAGAEFIAFGPIWQTLVPLLALMGLLEIVRSGIEIAVPQATAPLVLWRLAKWCGSLILLYFLIRADALLVPAHPAAATAQLTGALDVLNFWVRGLLAVATLIFVVRLVVDLRKLIAHKPAVSH